MTCWRGCWRRRISESLKAESRVGSSCVQHRTFLHTHTDPLPDTDSSGQILFIRSCRPQELGHSQDNSALQPHDPTKPRDPAKPHWISRILSRFVPISRSGQRVTRESSVKLKPKMDHSELVKELGHIEKLSNQERLKLAHNRRKLQLKYWNQYEKLLNNTSTTGSTGNGKKVGGVPFGKNNQQQLQQQRMLEQHLQTQELRRSKGKNKPNVKFCNSIMLLEAAGRNDISEVRRLLQDGVDPDVANEDGLTALHQCCIDDNEEMMKLLIESGANVNSEDSERWTPLHAASTCGHLHLVKHLIAKGANLLAVNAEGNMPYDICDEEATLDFIESEMAKRGVTQELIEEIRALPETRMLEDMKKLEREDGDLEARDRDGATYLHIASANGYSRVVEFLLDHHVATDVQDKDCWQPVHAAACWSHVEVLELLVGAGADLNARTKNNETPYAICEDLEIKERIIQLRSEQETKMKESGVKKLRRSVSSNSRTQSIRRTSQRDKQNATKRDAADEAAMLLAIATTANDSSPSPTSDGLTLEVGGHETSITSSEEEEVRSLPPWSQGRDSVTELHMPEGLGALRKSHNIPIESDSSADESTLVPRLNNIVSNGLRERNELSRSLQETGGTKFINPLSTPVSNPLLTDTNANLPHPDISPLVDIPKVPNPVTAPSTGPGVRICDSSDGTVDVSTVDKNSTIDIRVQVTINTNGSIGGSMNSLAAGQNGTFPASPRTLHPPALVQVTGPLFTPPGTLADLKKQRSLQYISVSRNSNTFPINGLKDFQKYEPPPSPSTSLKKFTGESVSMVGEDTGSRRKCCAIV